MFSTYDTHTLRRISKEIMQKKHVAIHVFDILLGKLLYAVYGLEKLQQINKFNKIQMVNTLDKNDNCWLGNQKSCIAVLLYL